VIERVANAISIFKKQVDGADVVEIGPETPSVVAG
jgi:hypothetical protein